MVGLRSSLVLLGSFVLVTAAPVDQNIAHLDVLEAISLQAHTAAPRPPQLVDVTSDLHEVIERFQYEDAAAASSTGDLHADEDARVAELQATKEEAHQSLEARKYERHMCEQGVAGLADTLHRMAEASDSSVVAKKIRADQATHEAEVGRTGDALARKASTTLDKSIQLLREELAREQSISGSATIDSVTLKHSQPEDMLRRALELSAKLGSLIQTSVDNKHKVIADLSATLACPACDQTATQLRAKADETARVHTAAVQRCNATAASHRPLDTADREKVLAADKQLATLEQSQQLENQAAAAVADQRKGAEHTAETMLRLYKTLANNHAE